MKFYILIGIFFLISCKGENQIVVSHVEKTNDAPFVIVDYKGLESYLEASKATVHILNFWATWCKPCVKELPYFEAIQKKYGDEDVKVILVSLDFPEQKEHLIHFIEKRNIQSEVVFLDDANANSWIPKVDVNWSGAIPATIIYTNDKRSFYEKSFTYNELEKELKLFL